MAEPITRERARSEPHVVEPEHRPRFALLCAAALFAVLAFGFLRLPHADAPLPAIARYAMEIALPQWKITEPVNEVVYGTRGFDTFGETFLLMAAIVSVATIARSREPRGEYLGEEVAGLREQRESDPTGPPGGAAGEVLQGGAAGEVLQGGGAGEVLQGGGAGEVIQGGAAGPGTGSAEESEAREAEQEESADDAASGQRHDGREPGGPSRNVVEPFAADRRPLGSRAPEHSEAMTVIVRVAARAAAVILTVTAAYVCARGYSPGGGFPAGAALSGVALLLYAALGYRAVSRVVRPGVLEPIEMVGALAVVALAALGLVLRGSVMANWLPLAPAQTILSGGLLQAFSVTELVEVGTGLTIAVFAVLSMEHDWAPDRSGPRSGEQSDVEPGPRRPAAVHREHRPRTDRRP